MYSDADFRAANLRARSWMLRLCAMLIPLLIAYVMGAVLDVYALMLLSLLVGFVGSVIMCDFSLLPALRYRRFLREMQRGMRRNTRCILRSLEDELQRQDGAPVYALHVELPDGDSRIFYVNAAKLEYLPEMNRWATLTSCGRHVLECRAE